MLKIVFSALALLSGAALTLSPASAQDKRMALVIGNGAYQNTAKLPNPARDANAVAGMFKAAGFEVVEAKTDLGIQEFKRVIRDFSQQTRTADIAVVYYAGHGIEIGGQNYLIPVDAKLRSDYDAEDEALTLDRVVRSVEPARKFRLVILDACRDNPFLKGMTRTASTRSITNGLGKVEPTIGDTLIAYAAKGGSVAEDGDGEHSPFTTALLRHLAEPGLDVRLAFGKVRDDVMRATGNKQEPFVYGSLGGGNVSIVPPKKVAPVADAKSDYELAERVGTKEAWDLFLKHHPTGFYAEMAKAQRAKNTLAAVAPVNPPPPPVGEGRPSTDETRAWDRVKGSDDRKALQDFIQRYPNSALAVLAQRRLDVLDMAERERQAARQREDDAKQAARAREEESKRAKAAAEEQKRLDREAALREEEAKKARAAAEAKQRQDDARTAKAQAEEQKKLEREAKLREDEAKKARAAADAKQREEEARLAKADDAAKDVKKDAADTEKANADKAKARKAAEREKADRQRAAARRADEAEEREERRRAARQREKSRASASREAPARASRPAPAAARAPVQMGRGGGGGGGGATMTGVGF